MSLSSLNGSKPTDIDVFVTIRHFDASGAESGYYVSVEFLKILTMRSILHRYYWGANTCR
jgi:hypothetical protein